MTEGPDLLVAVDGGNSKTDAAVVTGDGRVLAMVRGPGASAHALGAEGAVVALEHLIDRALRKAGVGRERVRLTAMYLAGVDFPREARELERLIRPRGWSPELVVDNDTFALLRTGTPGAGVAVVCGAGINSVAVDGRGGSVRFPSLGRLSGDWGGGEQLGLEAMAAAARDEDGRDRRTALTAAVRRHFDAPSVVELIERIHFGEVDRGRLHELSEVLFDVAAAGDPVAGELVERLAGEIAAFARASLNRLGLDRSPIVLGGGVLSARHPQLMDLVASSIARTHPDAELVYAVDRPISGAVLLGLERMDAHPAPETEARLRADLTAREAAALAAS